MAAGARDDNQCVVGMGLDGSTPVALSIDNATGYRKITMTPTSSVVPTVNPTRAIHDDNHVPTMIFLDGNDDKLTPVIDNTTGYRWVTATIA